MPSFINYNNKQELSSNEYTKLQISEALYLTETKNSRKIESLTEGLKRNTSLKDALDLFENKLVAMNALAATKQTYSGTLYEGQFSWMTQDSGQQIGSEKENTIDVWMYDNKGNQYYEKKYDGYGEFGGMDYYELLARMNGYTDEDLQDKKFTKSIRVMGKGSMRDIGIAIAFEKLKTRDKGGDVLFPALVADGKFNWKRHNFKIEAESDPNQSWFQEEEYDEEDDDYEQGWYENLDLHTSLYEQAVLENAVRDLHFETDPKKAEELKIEIGKSQGEVVIRKQIEGGEYSLRRFRKEIKYDTTGKDLGLFKPGSYMAATSDLGDGPHAKKVKKVKWNQKKYDQWLEDVASNDGWKNAGDMAQNAKHEPGLLDWAKKQFRGEDVMQRIQWDIEAFAESVVGEGVKGYKVGPELKDFDGMDFDKAQYVISNDSGFSDAVDADDWKPMLKIVQNSKYKQKLRKFLIHSDKDMENFAKWLSSGDHMKSESVVNEGNGQTVKEFGDLLALLLDEDNGMDIERAILAMDPKKARVLEKQISTLYKRLFDLTNQGFDLREDSSTVEESAITESKLTWDSLKESLGLNEGRSINKISKEHSAVVLDMKATVDEWKVAEGDRKSELLETLRGLNARKAELEKELDQAVAGKDSEVELALSESRELMKIDSYLNTKDEEVLIDFLDDAYGNSDDRKTRKEWEGARNDLGYNELIDYAVAHAENFGMDLQDIEDAIEVYEAKTINEKDDAGTHLDNLADLVGNAKSFMNVGKELKAGNYKYDFSTGMMPMYMIHADGFKFAILNKKYVDGGDREVGDIAIGLMESLNEQADDALILIQQALKGMKNMKVNIKGDTIIVSNKAKDEFTYSMNDADDVQDFIATIEESINLTKKKVESLDESLRNDLKKFIKRNQEELDRLADGEQWEQLYLFLYTEMDVEPESPEAEEIKAAFDLTY